MKKTTLGKILGAFGLISLLSSPFTLFFTAQSGWAAGAKAAVGVLLIAIYFVTNLGELGQFASRKSSFFFATTAVIAIFALGALVAVNYIVTQRNETWDLTQNHIYTLAPQTQSTLKHLKEKITAIGFLPADNPAYGQLEHIFQRYHAVAPDKFDYVFKDPMKNPELAAQYKLKQGQVTVVLTRGKGAQESHTSMNVVSEEALTNALIKLDSVGEQKVYFLQGQDEYALDGGGLPNASLSELKTNLEQEGYSPTSLNLAGKTEVPRDASLVVLVAPKTPLSDKEVKALSDYLDQGGRMLFFSDAGVNAGLEKLLGRYGVQVDRGVLADDKFAYQSPYKLITHFYAKHDITKQLEAMEANLVLPLVRGLSVLHTGLSSGVKAQPVVLTSPYAWEESTPDQNPAPTNGEKTGQIPVVVAVTRPTAGAPHLRYKEARLVVFGDSHLLTDANWGGLEPNRNLVLNAFGWASNQVSKITIRPPEAEISRLNMDPNLLSKIRFVATDLFPLALLGIGLAIWIKRRDQ